MPEPQLHTAYAEVNGVRLHYASSGTGPLILFVHGFPEFWYAWKDQLREFGADHHAVALDTRGYNLSAKPAAIDDYRAKHLVADLHALIRHLGARSAVVVAHDWGGAVAWSLAVRHPELVEKLIILNAPHPVTFARELRTNPAQQQASQYMNLFRSDKAERVLSEDNYRRLFAMTLDSWLGVRASDADRNAYRAAWSQPGALTGGLNYYRATALHPPSGDSAGAAAVTLDPCEFHVEVPTLVIWGERDPALLTGNLAGLEDLVRELEIVRVPEASHWIVHEQPELVNQLIRRFIAKG